MIRCSKCLKPCKGPRRRDELALALSGMATKMLQLDEENALIFIKLTARLLAGELDGLCHACTWDRAAQTTVEEKQAVREAEAKLEAAGVHVCKVLPFTRLRGLEAAAIMVDEAKDCSDLLGWMKQPHDSTPKPGGTP